MKIIFIIINFIFLSSVNAGGLSLHSTPSNIITNKPINFEAISLFYNYLEDSNIKKDDLTLQQPIKIKCLFKNIFYYYYENKGIICINE